eukprot:evm.model.scf_2355.2 EVM.evm.TU.scf_2355.2   scf_2355:20452-23707(-)
MGLDLDGLREKTREIKEREEEQEEGQDVKCLLKLPDGEEKMETFKLGTMVSYVKAYIQKKYGFAMAQQKLELADGSVMIDPLSLADIRGVDLNSVNCINVTMNG